MSLNTIENTFSKQSFKPETLSNKTKQFLFRRNVLKKNCLEFKIPLKSYIIPLFLADKICGDAYAILLDTQYK